ncbi:hypothetical protein T492DRAFT_836085 [Pavlovales sp. CCMP2436]|nr:hypothetical protein T492DRAFT_836085 [Pavlovales sp. CCMP2436]
MIHERRATIAAHDSRAEHCTVSIPRTETCRVDGAEVTVYIVAIESHLCAHTFELCYAQFCGIDASVATETEDAPAHLQNPPALPRPGLLAWLNPTHPQSVGRMREALELYVRRLQDEWLQAGHSVEGFLLLFPGLRGAGSHGPAGTDDQSRGEAGGPTMRAPIRHPKQSDEARSPGPTPRGRGALLLSPPTALRRVGRHAPGNGVPGSARALGRAAQTAARAARAQSVGSALALLAGAGLAASQDGGRALDSLLGWHSYQHALRAIVEGPVDASASASSASSSSSDEGKSESDCSDGPASPEYTRQRASGRRKRAARPRAPPPGPFDQAASPGCPEVQVWRVENFRAVPHELRWARLRPPGAVDTGDADSEAADTTGASTDGDAAGGGGLGAGSGGVREERCPVLLQGDAYLLLRTEWPEGLGWPTWRVYFWLGRHTSDDKGGGL